MSDTKQRGFTIIEILVVAGVVLVLLILGFPIVAAQIEKGRAASCLIKLRNLSVIMTQFRTERNQKMWNWRSPAEGGEGSMSPTQIFYKYGLIRSGKELCCPSANTVAKGAWPTGGSGPPDYMANVGNELVSYTVNGVAFYLFSPWYTSLSVNDFRYYLGHESKLPLFMDGKGWQCNITAWQLPNRFDKIDLRHNNRCHVLFMDGHVEALDRHAAERLDPNGGTNAAWLRDFGL